jgi:hypothetical protein
MTPIQLWLPTFFGGNARPELQRDMHRMFRARTTERVMWSVPAWMGSPRWTQGQEGVSCLNGDDLECVEILHIGEKGTVFGPAAGLFPDLSVTGLLDHWLLRIKIPHPVNGGVALAEAELPVPEEFYLPPFTHIGHEHLFAQWPPRPDMPTTVSPEMESVRSLSDGRRNSPALRYAWLAPFDELGPLLISLDDVHARDRMRQIAEASSGNCAKALAQATTEARGWISEGRASVNETWLQPLLLKESEQDALVAIYARYGKEVYSLEQVYKNEKLRHHLSTPMPVLRAWGIPGLMWHCSWIDFRGLSLIEHAKGAESPYRAGDISSTVRRRKTRSAFKTEGLRTSGEVASVDRVEDSRATGLPSAACLMIFPS